jgi:SAM-dependent methyltransferase
LPAPTASVGLLATLQVIEHVWDHLQYLRECRRVLAPGGDLLVTTPNRLTFSPGRDEPLNPFHTREFTAGELLDLLDRAGLRATYVGGLHAGPRLAGLDGAFGGSFVDAQLATPPDRWPAALADAVAGVRTGDFAVRDADRSDVDESLDLVVVARSDRDPAQSVG